MTLGMSAALQLCAQVNTLVFLPVFRHYAERGDFVFPFLTGKLAGNGKFPRLVVGD
jgi:hypothetical protein